MVSPTKKHTHLEWEVSIVELRSEEGILYKVTRRLPLMHVCETRMFSTLLEAKQQFDQWLE